MRWRVYLCSVLFVFSSLVVGSVIINAKNNVSAVSDISVTYDSSNHASSWQDVFPSCTTDCLNNYHYLIISTNEPNLNYQYFPLYIRFDGSAVITEYFSNFTPFYS